MIEYSQYSNYVSHNKTFNIVFCTLAAAIADLFLGILFYNLGIMSGNWGPLIILTLVTIPVIIFITESSKYEGVIAYHYTWKDIYHGLADKKLINEDYGKQHGVVSWKKYLRDKQPDRRWNYHVYTKYMEQLAMSRNELLVKIAEECAAVRSNLKKDLEDTNEILSNVVSRIHACEEELSDINKQLQRASTGAQKYHLQQVKKTKQNELEVLNNKKVELKCRINSIEDSIRRHEIAFISQKSKIEQDYKIRSERYARIATKAIEKNGLKYVIDALIAPEYWINNLQERSK